MKELQLPEQAGAGCANGLPNLNCKLNQEFFCTSPLESIRRLTAGLDHTNGSLSLPHWRKELSSHVFSAKSRPTGPRAERTGISSSGRRTELRASKAPA
jgi:hypothetical protein